MMVGPEDAHPALAGVEARGVEMSSDVAGVAGLARPIASAVELPKGWRTLQARALLAGFRADLIDDDRGLLVLVVSRWAMTRSFSSIVDAEAWLGRVLPPALIRANSLSP